MSKEKILIEVSARHVHVTTEDLETLFGKGYQLTPKKDLSQPGQYAAAERVDLVGPRSTLKNVSILGPVRTASQVEVSMSDARTLGLNPSIRESGNIDGTIGVQLVGPAGSVTLDKGLIVAKRHVHLTPEAAEAQGVVNGQVVEIKVHTDDRSMTFGDVVIRVSEKFAPAMHIDTDEANAAGITSTAWGEIV
ncbi:MAG TPA: propanediol utilization protein [Erysipelotrichaceae bacterium]|nr:propanediol utilization protein [Erysipelotrichaceae bacterium]